MTVDEILERSGDADDVLRGVVQALVDDGGCVWAAILFVEGDEFMLGPHAGEPDPGLRLQIPVVYAGARVAELVADGCTDNAMLERVANAIAELCLVGWDTAGEPWQP